EGDVVAGPGTFVLAPPGVRHTFANRGDAVVRMVNVHAPAGFDLRRELGWTGAATRLSPRRAGACTTRRTRGSDRPGRSGSARGCCRRVAARRTWCRARPPAP